MFEFLQRNGIFIRRRRNSIVSEENISYFNDDKDFWHKFCVLGYPLAITVNEGIITLIQHFDDEAIYIKDLGVALLFLIELNKKNNFDLDRALYNKIINHVEEHELDKEANPLLLTKHWLILRGYIKSLSECSDALAYLVFRQSIEQNISLSATNFSKLQSASLLFKIHGAEDFFCSERTAATICL